MGTVDVILVCISCEYAGGDDVSVYLELFACISSKCNNIIMYIIKRSSNLFVIPHCISNYFHAIDFTFQMESIPGSPSCVLHSHLFLSLITLLCATMGSSNITSH